MHKFRTVALTGVAALAVAGAALAAGRDMHILKVGLPDGSVARIEYVGDVAPRVTVAPSSGVVPVAFLDALGSSPFATFDRIAASMDANMEATVREVGDLQPPLPRDDGKFDLATLSELPAGTVSYRFVSTSNGNETCSRSLEMTSYGPDRKPRIVSSSSGDCTTTKRTPAPTGLDAPNAPAAPALAKTGTTAVASRPHDAANTI